MNPAVLFEKYRVILLGNVLPLTLLRGHNHTQLATRNFQWTFLQERINTDVETSTCGTYESQ